MEWDQIAKSWAAMTSRLRSDRIAGLVYAGASQGVRRAPGTAESDPGNGLPPAPHVTDNGPRWGQ